MAFLAPLAGLGAGTALSAIGTVFSAATALSQASAQAKAAEQKAAMLREDARIARETGAASAQDKGLQNAQILATLGAQQAGTGFDFNSPTFQEIRKTSRELGRRDQLRLNARGFNAGLRLDREASLINYQADLTRRASFTNAVGSLISDFTTFADLKDQIKVKRDIVRPRARPF